MRFTKMQGLGNDYVYVNCFEEKIDNPPELARRISDRHFGVGSDGLIMINPSDKADFEMEMYNADGSRGEMCGNGIRCVAKYVYDHGLTDKTDISVETLGGIKYLELTVEDGKVKTVKVDMGKPELEPQKIPVKADGGKAVDEPIRVGGEEYRMTCVSMGNPHAITFVEDVKHFPVKKYGEMIEVTIIKQCNYKQNAMGLFYIVSPEFLPIDLYIMEHQVGSMVEGIIFSIQGPLMTLMLDDNVFCTTKRSRHARTGNIVRCKIDKYNAKQRYIAVRVFE